MAREVSCRSLEIYFEVLGQRGMDSSEVFQGLPHTVEQLREVDRRIDWSVFAEVTRRMEQRFSEAEFVEMGASLFKGGRFLFVRRAGQLLASARQFYFWSNRFAKNAAFNHLISKMTDDPTGTIHLSVEIPQPYEPSRGYFLIAQGALAMMPTMIGLPPSQVSLDTDGRVGTYVIVPPRSRTLITRIQGLFRRAQAVSTTIRELEQSQVLLESRYRDLEDAKRRIELQKSTLELVNSATTAAIRSQRLGPMVATIADELHRGMGLSGVEVQVEVTQEETQLRACEVRGNAEGLEKDSFTEPLGEPSLGRLRVSRWPAPVSEADREMVRQVGRSVGLALGNAVGFEVIRSFREELESRVASRTTELSEAKDEVARSLESRNRFFANVNHELRTPLTVLLLGLDRLASLPEFRVEMEVPVASMRANAERLRSLVDDLLLLASGAEVGTRLRLRVVSVNALVDEVVAALKPQAEAKGLELVSECGPDLQVEGDARALDRALFNLVSNAIKYTAQGQVRVKASQDPNGEELTLEVKDTGEGIPADYLERVFERFVQVPGAKARPGAGIGLALVKEIAAQHSGSVSVESELKRGSRFTLRLPRWAPLEVRQRSEPALPDLVREPVLAPVRASVVVKYEVPRGWARLLVCEDNPELGDHIRGLLVDAGMQVTLVTSAEEALEVARRDPPDLLLTDLGLAGKMDGVALCRSFSAIPEHHNAPCLVLTANSLPGIRLQALDAGAVDYIVKPFTPNELIARVNAQLKLRRVSLQLMASERLAAQGAALAGVAHELRNPLNALINAVDPLRQSLPKEAAPPGSVAYELLEILKECGLRVSHLSYELLSMTHPEVAATESFDLADLLARSRKVMEPKLRQVELRTDLQAAGLVRAASAQLSQVLCNLLENAIDAAGEGGWVQVRTGRDGERAFLEVSDSGPGIPRNLRTRAFEPFFTTKAPGKGTGLGLSISRGIVQRYGGDLEIPEGDGPFVIRVRLPIAIRDGSSPAVSVLSLAAAGASVS